MTEHKRLLTQYINGDIKSINKLIEEYSDDIYNLCFRMTFSKFEADDLFQQTWEKVMVNAAKFTGNSFRNWIYTICVNTYKDICRKNERRRKIGKVDFKNTKDKEIAMALVSDSTNTEDIAQKNITNVLLAQLVLDLPEKLKSVVVLHYYQDLNYGDIAKILNVPQGTIKSRMSSAKKKLKVQLAESAQKDGSVGKDEIYAEYS